MHVYRVSLQYARSNHTIVLTIILFFYNLIKDLLSPL